MTRLGYHFRQALGCLRQAPYATTISVLTMGAALAFSGTTLLGARALENGLRSFATEARFTIFLTGDALTTAFEAGPEESSPSPDAEVVGQARSDPEVSGDVGAGALTGVRTDTGTDSETDVGMGSETTVARAVGSETGPGADADPDSAIPATAASAAREAAREGDDDGGDDTASSPGHRLALWAARTAGDDATAEFLSPDQALFRLREELGTLGSALDSLAENPLPPSIDVRLANAPERTLVDVHATAERLAALPFADEVDYGASFIDRLDALLAFVHTAGLALFLMVLGVTLFLVGNVVRLTVYARRDEIEILRLVGATDAFVATPFLLEGALQGLIGGILAAVGLVVARSSLFPRLTDGWGFGSQFQPPPPEPLLLLGLVATGITVGTVASALGVFRFLRSVR